MAFDKRIPPIKLILDKNLFNKLVSLVDSNINFNIEEEQFSKVAEMLKNKLLTYSVPKVGDDEVEYVEVRFFPQEASNMIWQLLAIAETNIQEDFYSTLLCIISLLHVPNNY